MWELVSRGMSVAQIAEQLGEEYDVSTAIVERDVQRIIDEIAAKGLLESKEGSLEVDPLLTTNARGDGAGGESGR